MFSYICYVIINYELSLQFVVPCVVKFPLTFEPDLLNQHSEKFRKAKLSIETLLYNAFLLVLKKAPIAIQVISFSYAQFYWH